MSNHSFINYYRHCGTEWQDIWSCACNDRCPVCNSEIEPYKSEDVNPEPIPLEEYAAQAFTLCPYCRSNDITGHQFDVDGKEARQEITCNACDKAWTDVYKLVRYEPS